MCVKKNVLLKSRRLSTTGCPYAAWPVLFTIGAFPLRRAEAREHRSKEAENLGASSRGSRVFMLPDRAVFHPFQPKKYHPNNT